MAKPKNQMISTSLEDNPVPVLLLVFPFFLVLFMGLKVDTVQMVLSASSGSWQAQILDMALLLALVNMALVIWFAPRWVASFKWFCIFILLFSAVAGLQGALDLAVLGAGAALALYSVLVEKGRFL